MRRDINCKGLLALDHSYYVMILSLLNPRMRRGGGTICSFWDCLHVRYGNAADSGTGFAHTTSRYDTDTA